MEVTLEQLRKDEQEGLNSHSLELKELRALLAHKERQLQFAKETIEVAKTLIDSALKDLKDLEQP